MRGLNIFVSIVLVRLVMFLSRNYTSGWVLHHISIWTSLLFSAIYKLVKVLERSRKPVLIIPLPSEKPILIGINSDRIIYKKGGGREIY